MADDTPHGENNEKPAEGQEQVPEQKETDWKAEARKWENRAKENLSAAKANEDAAKRLAEFEESQKTEAEKVAERLAAAEKRAAELEAEATRAKVAEMKGVPSSLLKGSTKEELEAHADELIKFKGDSGKGLHIPDEGNSPSRQVGENEFVRSLFGKGD